MLDDGLELVAGDVCRDYHAEARLVSPKPCGLEAILHRRHSHFTE